MLDVETKRRIDTARDILVGKVPDPKSQVEQITIALIYKFMDDIDSESEELGGRRTFFAGEFARYGWAKLMRSGLGGYEMLNLYAEAIDRIPENPGIPSLFRDIFNNAYLPYRDPETLRAFLKVIDEFVYDHSERLGDAFEYLLSVLGSQGDAGQFRTPRHIIDFMVSIVDPKKDDVVLDPACGTAGFLISSYKHILRANEDGSGQDGSSEGGLTPEEKGRLAGNFSGYDISPDMVRLSLVNMYLHGFRAPHIHEYDTLTSEDRWNEYADVILANPPFMSPKGGIRPHNRFSVKSKRSEVLFVDYMAEHLTPSGRAGIIVPEGIIFQSQNAHRRLRKMLVEDYLVAVVSLPAGVFQPYSGVKTSILILDKALAKRTDRIAFFKVENDGFDLGAQRRPIDKNDLPEIAEGVNEYLAAARAGVSVDETGDGPPAEYLLPRVAEDASKYQPGRIMDRLVEREAALVVAKEEIAANREYHLSGERYRVSRVGECKWPRVALGEIFKLSSGRALTRTEMSEGPYTVYGGNGATGCHSEYFVEDPILVIGRVGAYCGVVHITRAKAWVTDNGLYVTNYKQEVNQGFLARVLTHLGLRQFARVGGQPSISQTTIYECKVPLPPLEVQKEIVAEIEGYQRVIDGARAVVENYRPHIAIDPDWPVVRVADVFRKSDATVLPKSLRGPVTYIGLQNIAQDSGQISGDLVVDNPAEIKSLKNVFEPGDILYGKLRPNLNKVWLADRTGICSTDIFVLQPLDGRVLSALYVHLFRSDQFNSAVLRHVKGAQLPRVGYESFADLRVPLPPLSVQQEIVADIEAEQGLVNANRELIRRFEKKIDATIARVWGEE